MGIHDGHRARMKQRFLTHGLSNFDDHSVLELLLFFAQPRRDVNPLAHELLDRFGTLDGVFEAQVEELARVPGLGDSSALLLKLIPQIARRYSISAAARMDVLDSTSAAGAYLVPLFMYERDEVVYLICLDSKCKVISCRELSRGVVTSAEVSVRRIVETALSNNATGVILAHNHVGGLALPSAEDKTTTLHIKNALAPVGITLADHIIVSGDDFVSMADSGLLNAT